MPRSWPAILASRLEGVSEKSIRFFSCSAGLLAVTCYFLTTGPFQFPFDDSYITLEFARNFAATGQFTYDGMYPATGATSPLHVLLLALASRLGLGVEAANAAFGVLFFTLVIERTGALSWQLTRSKRATLFSTLVVGLSGYLVYDSLNGLESTLFIFLAVAWVHALTVSLERGLMARGVVVWLFLAVLARPEALWLAAGASAYLLLRASRHSVERRSLAILLVSLVATGTLALGTKWLVTGSLSPDTALAKMYLFGDFQKPLGERVQIFWHGLREVWSPLYFFLLLGFWARRTRIIAALLLPWLVITEALFCLLLPGQVATYWGRYQHPLMPFVFVLAGDGADVLIQRLGHYRVGRPTRILAIAMVAMLCSINLREFRVNLRDDKQIILDNHVWAVDWLRRHAPPAARIGTHDIGVLRYVGRHNLVDVSGLTDPAALERNRAGQGQFEYLASQRPDYLIGIDFWLDGYLHYFPQLDCCCHRVAHAAPRTPTPIRLSIFQCSWEDSGVAPASDVETSCRP